MKLDKTNVDIPAPIASKEVYEKVIDRRLFSLVLNDLYPPEPNKQKRRRPLEIPRHVRLDEKGYYIEADHKKVMSFNKSRTGDVSSTFTLVEVMWGEKWVITPRGVIVEEGSEYSSEQLCRMCRIPNAKALWMTVIRLNDRFSRHGLPIRFWGKPTHIRLLVVMKRKA